MTTTTNTQPRIQAIYSAADRAGLPLEVKQGLWQQLAEVSTARGRDMILTRWEDTSATWSTSPVSSRARRNIARAEYVV